MLLKDVLQITRELEKILFEEAEKFRDSRLEVLANDVYRRFGITPESEMIVEGIRSWMTEAIEEGEAV